jgi:DNA-binding transcriptional LysR family regulator
VAGLGIACVLSYQAARPIEDGALRLLLDDCAPPAMPVSLVHREARLPPARVRSFVSFAAIRLRQNLRAASAA